MPPGRLSTYVVEFYVNPTAQGVVTVSIEASTMFDQALNHIVKSTYTPSGATVPLAVSASFLFDNISPLVNITTSTLDLTNTLRTYTATFSEDIEYFTADTVTVTGGEAASVTAVSGSVYEFVVVPHATSVDQPIRVEVLHNATGEPRRCVSSAPCCARVARLMAAAFRAPRPAPRAPLQSTRL